MHLGLGGAVAAVIAACGARSGLDVSITSDTSPNTPVSGHGTTGPGAKPPGPDGAGVPLADAGADHASDAALPLQCLASSHQTHGVPTDLFFMVDKSGSMATVDPGSDASRWVSVGRAMADFLGSDASAGLGAGIAFFPIAAAGGAPDCNPVDYATPVVPMAPLPGPVRAISTAILTQALGRGTPTTPALQGAYAYTQGLQTAEPDRNVAVLLSTDGNPIQCGSDIATASAMASVGAAGTPPVRTYVLGIGPNLTNLNAIAQAGGTGHAYLVESGGADALTDALNAIRSDSIACEYVFPPLNGVIVDGAEVSVHARVGLDGTSAALGQVANVLSCAVAGGWYFDSALRPASITLCPASCDPLLVTSGSALDILIDCH